MSFSVDFVRISVEDLTIYDTKGEIMKKLLQELSFFQHFSDIGLFVLSDQDFHILYCNEYMEKNS